MVDGPEDYPLPPGTTFSTTSFKMTMEQGRAMDD